MKFKQVLKHNLNESSLSVLYNYMQDHECGTVTAWRRWKEDEEGKPIIGENGKQILNTLKYKREKNKELQRDLFKLGYLYVVVNGHYKEYGDPVHERTFFVVDQFDKGTLKEDLIILGHRYYQDSVLYINEGGRPAYAIGTFDRPFDPKAMKYGEEFPLTNWKWGEKDEMMTTIRGRPIVYIP